MPTPATIHKARAYTLAEVRALHKAWTLHFLPEAKAKYARLVAAGEYWPDPDQSAWKWAEWQATIPTQSGRCPPWLAAMVQELARLSAHCRMTVQAAVGAAVGGGVSQRRAA